MSKKNPSRRERRDEATKPMGAAAAAVRSAQDEVEGFKETINELKDEMESWFDGMPEGLQGSEQGERVSAARDALQEALDAIDDIDLEDTAAKIEEAAELADSVDFPGMYNK